MKALKHIVALGASTLVCWTGWMVGVTVFLGMAHFDSGTLATPKFWDALRLMSFACLGAALASSSFWNRTWKNKSNWGKDLALAAVHELTGSCIFTGLIVAFGGDLYSGNTFMGNVIGVVGMGLFFGLIYGILLMPIQIWGSFLQIRIHRHLARRFGLLPTP